MSKFFKTIFGISTNQNINDTIVSTQDNTIEVQEFVKYSADELYERKENAYHIMMNTPRGRLLNYYADTSPSQEFGKLRRFYIKFVKQETRTEQNHMAAFMKKIEETPLKDVVAELNNLVGIVQGYDFDRFTNENIFKVNRFIVEINSLVDDLRYILTSINLWNRKEDFLNQAFVVNYSERMKNLTATAQKLAAEQSVFSQLSTRREFLEEDYKQTLLKRQERDYHNWLKKQNRGEDRYDHIENENIKTLLYNIETLFTATSKIHDELEVEEQYLIEEIMYNYIPESIRLLESFRVKGTAHRAQAEKIIIQKLELFETQFNDILEVEEKASLKKLEALLSSASQGTVTGAEA